ncbi:Cytochrome P450 84A1 [Hibiscus syriacus]|uniref:Cytochrome P450 84A1 n=1 Tax=Hibiscus syriacus TaxID=106335 RepID=A0A6A3BUL7_HIBSY|nr:Cytochrome P450 84A1 [Hibiscus syriacus]
MFGGTETVASAIKWAMAELMKSPAELQKVQQELSDVIGLDRVVQESDLEKLTYLKSAIKETLRLHPPIPLLLHETSVDSILGGYRVPAKSRIMINAWATGVTRHLGKTRMSLNRAGFWMVMHLTLRAVILSSSHSGRVEGPLPDGMKPSELDMNDSFGLTAPRATRLVAVRSYRLSCPFRGK